MASLVSSRDSEHLWLHITDSLSLLPAVRSCGGASPRLFDIGSGAGFPALPLALTCPELCFHMVERARKKAGFLELALGELGLLQRGAVEQGGFPQEVSLDAPEGWLVTARAIEKIDAGQAQALFFMNPTRVAEVEAVVAEGEKMPQKSTFFFPKIFSGLVVNVLQ